MPAKFKVGDIVRPNHRVYPNFLPRHTGTVVDVQYLPLTDVTYVRVAPDKSSRTFLDKITFHRFTFARYLFNANYDLDLVEAS